MGWPTDRVQWASTHCRRAVRQSCQRPLPGRLHAYKCAHTPACTHACPHAQNERARTCAHAYVRAHDRVHMRMHAHTQAHARAPSMLSRRRRRPKPSSRSLTGSCLVSQHTHARTHARKYLPTHPHTLRTLCKPARPATLPCTSMYPYTSMHGRTCRYKPNTRTKRTH